MTAYKIQTPVDILIGNYNPAFKLHFYFISLILILSVLNCLYGFGQIVKTGDKKRLKTLVLQSVSAAATILMYIGEAVLLHGHLYSFGGGFF